MTSNQPVIRFAPSPTGELHLGHAYSALFTQDKARELDARLLLRIEDIDLVRCRAGFIQGIFDDLEWLGLEWEVPVRRQSEHFADYRAALSRLEALGLVYPCFATRTEIKSAVATRPGHPRDPDGTPVYPGLSKSLSETEREARSAAGEPFAVRLDMARAQRLAREIAGSPVTFHEHQRGPGGETGDVKVDAAIWGDVVVARKDIKTSYHLAVVVDDAFQGITDVTRGQDLFYATYVHRILQVLLELPEPQYHHHELVRDTAGRRLSKSARDQSLRALRESGITASDIKAQLGFNTKGTDHPRPKKNPAE